MWLIGQRCKCGDTLSWLILIGRGLDLKKQKEEKWVRWTRFFALLSWQSKRKYPVMMAKRIHPFPFRTRKLSSSALMVLGGRPPGRVGRCRNERWSRRFKNGGFSLTLTWYFSLALGSCLTSAKCLGALQMGVVSQIEDLDSTTSRTDFAEICNIKQVALIG